MCSYTKPSPFACYCVSQRPSTGVDAAIVANTLLIVVCHLCCVADVWADLPLGAVIVQYLPLLPYASAACLFVSTVVDGKRLMKHLAKRTA